MVDLSSPSPASLAEDLAARLTRGALPGELIGFGPSEVAEAARFVAATAARRTPGEPALQLEPIGAEDTRRRMRLAIVNDDMPFLVDSIAAAIADHGLAIDRIIHPVIRASRTDDGVLEAVGGAGQPESMIYLELERADARERRDLVERLGQVLADVRAAVADWPRLQRAVAADEAALPQGEGAALLQWFLDGRLTLLGHQLWRADGPENEMGAGEALGIARNAHKTAILAEFSRNLAIRWFEAGGEAPLLLKSSLISTVHRAVPLDLVLVPIRARDEDGGDAIAGLSIHAGLWTSAALNAPPEDVPVLRTRLAQLEAKFGFDPKGHTGKALTHALAQLPHDLAVAFEPEQLEELALTAMSLADRPRPALVLVRSALGRHLFAFAWLPRDDLTTARRIAIGEMVAEASNGPVLNWSVALEDSAVALIRYTVDLRNDGRVPDVAPLQARLERMVRGWTPAVEAALSAQVGPARAARLALKHAACFPQGFRNASTAEEAAADVLRLSTLGSGTRSVRLSVTQGATRLKIYRQGGPLALSDAVPVLENFGFRVIEEIPTALTDDARSYLHEFLVEAGTPMTGDPQILEQAIAAVLEGRAENDQFNRLIVDAGLEPRAVLLFRAWFRYLRQAGLPYGLSTVVDALRRAPAVATALVARFTAAHDPQGGGDTAPADATIEAGLDKVAAIDDDRILRAYRALVAATLRTNAFTPAGEEALAFKLDSHLIPGLPAPVPWREIWVYSPRVEGIHLRAGPVARGGLRWSDRRDDFRVEILGLMKAQRVKNAVIVPTGAKGGFYPKQLPPMANRDAWLAEGTESYRVFIRALLSITDNIVDGAVTHPDGVRVLDGDDPYFVVAADKGTATFSDVANALALERGFWLGDAFASGGSVGYDHKAMGITAKGAWISVQRHFAERGLDVQADPITVVGCGDMSGDVFGNGMLLSKAIKLVAAFDHRHIFLDPSPDAAVSWAERARLFALPRSSWADYAAPVSAGGGVHSRAAKSIAVTPEAAAALGIPPQELKGGEMEPSALISAILKAPADLIWFGGIGTYVKAAAEANSAVGDPANDAHRVNAEDIRAKVIGEGANLGVTQAARIAFSLGGGRINTDFIDNSAGVDCSDHEVNIKIALNAEVAAGRLTLPDRNVLLAEMTDDVATDVLEDNRLQTLALSIAERGGAAAVPSLIRLIETFEASGRLDRAVAGLPSNDMLARRAQDGHGLTRPELAVLLATAKLALQDAIETADLGADPAMTAEVLAAFPRAMRERHGDALTRHQLRRQIVATRIANRMVNRMGLVHPFELAEEEGASMGDIAAAFEVGVDLFGVAPLWADIDAAQVGEGARLLMFEQVAVELRAIMADLLRAAEPGRSIGATVDELRPEITVLDAQVDRLLHAETRAQASDFASRLTAAGAPEPLVDRIVRIAELDGSIGMATLSGRAGVDPVTIARAFTALGSALGLDWAQGAAMRANPVDPWERLLVAGLARDFQQMRLDFLARDPADVEARVASWLEAQAARVRGLRTIIDRARGTAPTPAMLAQIAGQARVLLTRG